MSAQLKTSQTKDLSHQFRMTLIVMKRLIQIISSGSEIFRIYSKNVESHRENFKKAQQNASQIWRRFQKEYIPMHLARNKDFKDQKTQFQEGELE